MTCTSWSHQHTCLTCRPHTRHACGCCRATQHRPPPARLTPARHTRMAAPAATRARCPASRLFATRTRCVRLRCVEGGAPGIVSRWMRFPVMPLHEPTPGREASQRTVASPVLSEVRAWPPWQDSDAPTTCNAGVRWRFEAWRRMRTQRRVPQVLCRGRAMTRTACVAACDAQGLAALPSLRRRHTHQRVWQRGGPLGSAPGVAGEVRCHTLRTCALRGAAGGHHATPGPCVGRIESTAGRGGVPFDTVPGSTVALRGPTGGWAPYCAAPAEDATVGVSCAATSQVGGCLFHLALPTGASVHTQCGAQRLTCARSLAGCEASRRRCHPARAAQHGTGGAQRCCGTVRCVVAWQRPQSMGMYVRVSWGPQHTNSVGRVRAEAVPRRAPRFSRRSSLPTQTRTSKCGRSSLLTSKTD